MPDIASLNVALHAALEKHNNRNLDRRNYSRREYFEDIERDALRPLNPIRFQIKKRLSATVDKYGYVRLRDDAHFYSVPHTFIGKKLQIYYTSMDVEVFSDYTRVAHHTRDRHPFRHTTDPEHLCPKHRAIAGGLLRSLSHRQRRYTKTWSIISGRSLQRRLTSTRRINTVRGY